MTRRTPKTTPKDGGIAVADSPELAESAQADAEMGQDGAESEEDEESAPSVATETANREEIEKKGRGSRAFRKVPSVGFFARLTQYSKEEWENQLMLYLYRLAPITDRLATGNQVKYIARFTEPIDEDTILKDKLWGGSGKYRCTLNKRDPSTGRSSALDQVEFEVEQVAYPPVVPPGEWVDDPRNKRWAWARKETPTPAASTAAAPAPPPPAGTTIKELVEGVTAINELTRANQPAPAPPPPPAPDPAAQFRNTIEAVKELLPKSDDSLLKFVIDRLTAAEDRSTKFMDRLLNPPAAAAPPPPPAPAPDPFRDLAMKRLEKQLEKLDEPAGETAEARHSRMTGWQEVIVGVLNSPALEKAFGLLGILATAKAAQPIPMVQQPRPRPPQTVDANATPVVQQPEPQQPQQPQPTEEPPVQIDPRKAVLNFVLSYVTPTMLDHMENGDGGSFAVWFCDSVIPIPNAPPGLNRLPGTEAHKFAKQAGRDMIIEAYQANAELWKEIAPTPEARERFVVFIDQFLKYDPNAEEEE